MRQLRMAGSMMCTAILLSSCTASNYELSKTIGPVNVSDVRTYGAIRPLGSAQIRAVNGKRMIVGGDFDFCGVVERQVADAGWIYAAPGRYTLTVMSYRITNLRRRGKSLEPGSPERRAACDGFEGLDFESEVGWSEYQLTFDLHGAAEGENVAPDYTVHISSTPDGSAFVAVTLDDDPTIIASSNKQVVGHSIGEFKRPGGRSLDGRTQASVSGGAMSRAKQSAWLPMTEKR